MKSYKHILWDWNGTLLNDVWLCIDITNAMLTKRRRPNITHQQYYRIFDFPVEGYYERAGFDFTTESFESVCTEYCDQYVRRVHECNLNDNALDVLRWCADNDISQSILSTTEQGRLERMVDVFRASHFFDRVIGQSDAYAKGKTESGKRVLNQLGFQEDMLLLIGDTTHDAQVAKAMGIDCFLVAIGHHAIEKLKRTGIQVLGSLSEVTSWLDAEEGHIIDVMGLQS